MQRMESREQGVSGDFILSNSAPMVFFSVLIRQDAVWSAEQTISLDDFYDALEAGMVESVEFVGAQFEIAYALLKGQNSTSGSRRV